MEITNLVEIKKLTETAKIPTHGSDIAAGYDLYADIPDVVMIPPHTTKKIGTGIALAISELIWAGVFARSGLATKEGLRPANCVGVIDPDYRGEVIVALHNDTNENKIISPQERIAQLVFFFNIPTEFKVVEELSETKRGEGGFGSTGKI